MGWVKEQLDDTPIVSQVSDVIHDVSEDTGFNDMAEKFYDDPIKAVSDDLARFDDNVLQPVTGGVSDALADVDDFVNDEIPGGWPMVAALAIGGYHAYPYLAGSSSGLAGLEAAGMAGMDIGSFGGSTLGGAEAAGMAGMDLGYFGGMEAAGNAGMDLGYFGGMDAAGNAGMDIASFGGGYDVAGLDNLIAQQNSLYPMSGYNEVGLNNLIAEKSQPTTWQQMKNGFKSLPPAGQRALTGAGQGMLTNATVNLATGRPITPEGLLLSAAVGGAGGGVAGLTGSNWLGGLTAVGTNALLSKSLGPKSLTNALPYLGTSLSKNYNTGAGMGPNTGPNTIQSTSSTPRGKFLQGSQIGLPLTGLSSVPTPAVAPDTATASLDPYRLQEIQNELQLEQIQNAKNGGIMHRATGGDLPMNAKQLRGRATQHANPFIRHGALLSSMPGFANGGDASMPEGHNPEFFSEGGLSSIENRYVTGNGDGTSDSIPAMLANGEFVIPADVVSGLGNGSNDSGAKVLDEFMKIIRAHKQNHDAKHLPPDSKGPLTYLTEAQRKVRT